MIVSNKLIREMFKPIARDLAMFEAAFNEILQPNLDSILVFLNVFKEEFNDLKTKDAYEMLITLPKLEAEESELMFIQDADEEELDELEQDFDELEEKEDEKPKVSKIRQETFAATRAAYEQAWLVLLSKISDKGNKMVKRTLSDLP